MTKTTVIATDKGHLEKLIEEAIQIDGHFCDLNYIDVSQVTDMSELFMNSAFQGDISAWNVANVHNMSYMFYKSQFNGEISTWNTSRVKDMFSMFRKSNFNGDISAWNVANVHDMACMFKEAAFNSDVSTWSFHNDINVDQFDKPNLYHWVLLLKGSVTQKAHWREHFNVLAPIVKSLGFDGITAAKTIQAAWNGQSSLIVLLKIPDCGYES